MKQLRTGAFGLRGMLALGLALGGTAEAAIAEDFTSLDLEQLMALEVTGVTRRAETYASVPAAVYVLTGEDIRRSGARTIADALRLVPGLFVARTNAAAYAVSARGFSTGNSDKLQVLVDGRSVYAPLTSAVFWDVLDTYLEDVDRIEVIRGPGATVWGANAVNGVINILTRPARETQGTHLRFGAGTEERAFGGFRSGSTLGDWGHGRAYAKAFERDSTRLQNGNDAPDGQSHVQAGSRVDATLDGWGRVVASGDIYDGRQYSSFGRTEVSGRNLGAEWVYGWSDGAETRTHLYYDGYDRFIPGVFEESRDTGDLGIQHNLQPLGRHRITAGVSARVSADETGGPPLLIIFEPSDRTIETYGAFLQDEIALSDSLSLVAGSKFEYNDFTGFEVQPGVRLGWQASPRWFSWASVSRAVRTPNRLDEDIGLLCAGVVFQSGLCQPEGSVVAIGNRDFESEELLAYEWGLRNRWSPTVFADLAMFYNEYDELRSTEPGLRFANGLEGVGYGGELALAWQWREWAAVQLTYSYLRLEIDSKPGSNDTTTPRNLEQSSPRQQASLRLALEPLPTVTVDGFMRFVDELPAQDIESYTELDLRGAWRVRPGLELSLLAQNLLDRSHPEFGSNRATRSEIERGVLAQVSWSWK